MKKISPTAALNEMGIGRSVFTKWKDGATPHDYTVHRVADYFGVSPEDLNDPDFVPPRSLPSAKSESSNEMNELLEAIRTRPIMRALFSVSSRATDDDINEAIDTIIRRMKG